jgi:hypothetical protein
LSIGFCFIFSAMNDDLFSLPSDIEFALLHFHLEFQERFRLNVAELLRLRRELLVAAGETLGGNSSERYKSLFDPPLPTDPVALRRFQRPSPPFAFLLHPEPGRNFDAGDRFEISVSFWGRGVHSVSDFARVLQALGKRGIYRGQGPCELVTIEADDASGNRVTIWREREGFHLLAPPVNEISWWLKSVADPTAVDLEFLTPARLLSQGRPLFRLDFRRLFPFILRRVTSMLYTHCGREVVDDPGWLLSAADRVHEVRNTFSWQDWRTLEGEGQTQDLGGIMGSVRLEGENLQRLIWVLRLGSLMNVGKGAAFGAGVFRLCDARLGGDFL